MIITLSHREMLDTLQTLAVLEALNNSIDELDEAMWCAVTKDHVLNTMHSDASGCSVELDGEQCFGIWLALDLYKQFAIETKLEDEIVYVSQLMAKLRG